MALTMYKLRGSIDGADLVAPVQALHSLSAVEEHESVETWDFTPRLFLARSVRRFPPWTATLRPHYPEDTFRQVRGAGAVLFVQAPSFPGVWFAFTFGQRGRYLLRPDAYVRHFGLRTALNVIYADEGDGAARVRSVDTKTVSANTLRTRMQTDRRALFEDFGVDARRDLLNGITGRPANTAAWGPRVSGTDRLSVTRKTAFDELGEVCDRAEEAYAQIHYQTSFKWIDDLSAVSDPSVAEALVERVVEQLKAGESPLELAIPEIVEWGDIAEFGFSFDGDATFVDPEDVDLSTWLATSGRLNGLSVNGLKNTHRVEAWNEDGERIGRWSLLQCLSGEVELDGATYVLSEGDFFKVRAGLIAELGEYVDSLQPSTVALPASPGDIHEDVYNAHAVDTVDGTLLLDRRNVTIAGATSAVEVCDVLSSDGNFVHVKRKLGSSQLSHLFSQGARSLELAVISPDFRTAALAKIAEVAGETGKDLSAFAPFTETQIDATSISVDYAIVAKWNGRPASEGLPFFSQLNLRSFAEQIGMFRGRVTLTRVEIEE